MQGGGWMSNISNMIERHLKQLLAESREGYIEIRRNVLAEHFSCVPSQINYVLATRFSVESGFVVESRRGGGGYVRIIKVPLDDQLGLLVQVCELVGSSISEQGARGIIRRLLEEGLISSRESALMLAAVNRDIWRLTLPARDQVRANILKAMLMAVLQGNCDRQHEG